MQKAKVNFQSIKALKLLNSHKMNYSCTKKGESHGKENISRTTVPFNVSCLIAKLILS